MDWNGSYRPSLDDYRFNICATVRRIGQYLASDILASLTLSLECSVHLSQRTSAVDLAVASTRVERLEVISASCRRRRRALHDGLECVVHVLANPSKHRLIKPPERRQRPAKGLRLARVLVYSRQRCAPGKYQPTYAQTPFFLV